MNIMAHLWQVCGFSGPGFFGTILPETGHISWIFPWNFPAIHGPCARCAPREAEYHFTEAPSFLRRNGVLDESVPEDPKVETCSYGPMDGGFSMGFPMSFSEKW